MPEYSYEQYQIDAKAYENKQLGAYKERGKKPPSSVYRPGMKSMAGDFLSRHIREKVRKSGIESLTFTDVIAWGHDRGVSGDGRFQTYGMLCGCSGCGGMKGVFVPGLEPDATIRGDLASLLLLVKQVEERTRSDGGFVDPHPCDCKEQIAKLKARIDAELPKVLKDTTWNHDGGTSIPNRGINDFRRSIRFERELTDPEMQLLTEWLQRDHCPGWTGIDVRRYTDSEPGVEYGFSTTWDSSD